jgi:hypothetical protein
MLQAYERLAANHGGLAGLLIPNHPQIIGLGDARKSDHLETYPTTRNPSWPVAK